MAAGFGTIGAELSGGGRSGLVSMATASDDWPEMLTAVALEVLGQPEERRGNEWCYGPHGPWW